MTGRIADTGTNAIGLHHRAIVVDCHNDLPVATLLHHHEAGVSHDWVARWGPELRAGGVDVVVLPVWISPREGERSLRRSLIAIELLRRDIAAHPDEVAQCRTGVDIRAAVAGGRLAVVVALEGISYLDADLELLATYATLGVRMVSLAHFGRTVLADGSAEDAAGGRLTTGGIEMIAELERLGIIVDISHLGAASLDHLFEVATRPLVASHSAARALNDHHRNLTDAQLARLAATGGVVAVNFTPAHVRPDAVATAPDVVAHIRHIADVVGTSAVGIGPDLLAPFHRWAYPMYGGLGRPGARAGQSEIDGPADLPRITEALLDAGFTEAETTGILGENLLRLFDEVLRA